MLHTSLQMHIDMDLSGLLFTDSNMGANQRCTSVTQNHPCVCMYCACVCKCSAYILLPFYHYLTYRRTHTLCSGLCASPHQLHRHRQTLCAYAGSSSYRTPPLWGHAGETLFLFYIWKPESGALLLRPLAGCCRAPLASNRPECQVRCHSLGKHKFDCVKIQ